MTFAVKAAIMLVIAYIIFAEYRRVMAERSDIQVTGETSVRSAITNRLYGLALSLSNIYE